MTKLFGICEEKCLQKFSYFTRELLKVTVTTIYLNQYLITAQQQTFSFKHSPTWIIVVRSCLWGAPELMCPQMFTEHVHFYRQSDAYIQIKDFCKNRSLDINLLHTTLKHVNFVVAISVHTLACTWFIFHLCDYLQFFQISAIQKNPDVTASIKFPQQKIVQKLSKL